MNTSSLHPPQPHVRRGSLDVFTDLGVTSQELA